jgi:hypothetical protein
MSSPPDLLLEWLTPYPDFVRELVLRARQLVAEAAPEATEIIADGVNAVAVGFGYTHTHVKAFIYIAACSDHVNFGFNYGASFDDPQRRLLGAGNQSRHMKVYSLADLADPYLLAMLEQAHARAFRPDPPLTKKLVAMLYDNAKKRRPSRA